MSGRDKKRKREDLSKPSQQKPKNEKQEEKKENADQKQEKPTSSSSASRGKVITSQRSRKSPVWQHFIQIEHNVVECKHCKKEMKFYSSTSGMKGHVAVCAKLREHEGNLKNFSKRQKTIPSLMEEAEIRKDKITKAFVMNGIAYRVNTSSCWFPHSALGFACFIESDTWFYFRILS